MTLTLIQELLHSPPNRSSEQQLSSIRIVKLDWQFFIRNALQEIGGRPVSSVFRIMTIVIANTIGRVVIAIPSQILLDWSFGCPVCLLGHDLLVGVDGVLAVGSLGAEETEQSSSGCGAGTGGTVSGVLGERLLREGAHVQRECEDAAGFGEFHRCCVVCFVA